MLKAIKSFFEQNILFSEKQDKDHALKLASTALLLEMTRMDDLLHHKEWSVLLESVANKFQLNESETHDLLLLAQAELENSTDYYQFTSLINASFEYKDKCHIIELLWQVAFADGELDKDEEYLVRKISELLYVSHEDFIAGKLKVHAGFQKNSSSQK